MNEDEQSGHSILVSAIAACGLALLAALTAPLWSGLAQNWLGPLKDWLPPATSLNQTPQAPAQGDRDRAYAVHASACADDR